VRELGTAAAAMQEAGVKLAASEAAAGALRREVETVSAARDEAAAQAGRLRCRLERWEQGEAAALESSVVSAGRQWSLLFDPSSRCPK
jgi:CHASE1-domain containing sensor protein